MASAVTSVKVACAWSALSLLNLPPCLVSMDFDACSAPFSALVHASHPFFFFFFFMHVLGSVVLASQARLTCHLAVPLSLYRTAVSKSASKYSLTYFLRPELLYCTEWTNKCPLLLPCSTLALSHRPCVHTTAICITFPASLPCTVPLCHCRLCA